MYDFFILSEMPVSNYIRIYIQNVKKMSKRIIKKELVLVEESIKYGDINGNGKIDSADAVAIKKYLAGYSDTINKKAADVTGDGKIDVNDAIRLLKYLAGYDVTLGAA